jgi:hypothetical protein
MNYRQEIQRMKQGGYSIVDTYIYVKDYIEFETLIEIWETASCTNQ